MIVELHFSPDPARAEAVVFERREDADACAATLARFARLKPEGGEWHFDLVLSERWQRRVYCSSEFSAFFRVRGASLPTGGIRFSVEKDSHQSPGYRVGFAAGWLVRHERSLTQTHRSVMREDLEIDLAAA